MVQTIIASAVIANGLRADFQGTYTDIRNRQADGRVGMLMSNVGMTNRYQAFAYMGAAPHMELWKPGDPVPSDAMDSTSFTGEVHNWARRIPWLKWDRKDDQLGVLYDAAKKTGESTGLLPERFLFDLLNNALTPITLPATMLAPDGAAIFATTAGGVARFGATNGNLLSGSGLATSSAVRTDYYSSIKQFGLFQDGKGQPLLSPETIGRGVLIIHALADTDIFEETFLQRRQGRVLGTDAGVSVSNVIQDASRTIELWGSPRLATGDWYVALKDSPTKPFALLDREGVREFEALEDNNNSDHVRNTGQEYVQWETRQGAVPALPYGIIKINN